ncbi:MAG TPA: DNA recombination protein RmuC, partial [Bauldia sp.]|nr:DNA recombination protein RmuC [Bauldia sp.]
MDRTFEIGGYFFTLWEAAAAGVAFAASILVLLLLVAWRRAVARAEHNAALETQFAQLLRTQSEMQGRMQTIAEVFGSRQSDLVKGLSERMDGLGHKLGQSMLDTTRHTQENLTRLAERLAVIDKAQQNITALSSQVVELQKVLANKQTRGAFGEARMQAIIQDGLPQGAYKFQPSLSNGNRPDCLILFPNGAPALVVDAKFPLEAWNAIRAAETPEAAKQAETMFRRDILKHVQDIAARYQIVGETHDTCFMFVPSESIFADIHERFEDVVQRAHRARVVIVSPSLLMLSVQVVMSLLRDVRMREQAHVIQQEVSKLLEDVRRLD